MLERVLERWILCIEWRIEDIVGGVRRVVRKDLVYIYVPFRDSIEK